MLNQAEVQLPPDLLVVILGPTASGKTKLAVQLAQQIRGEIISVDARQVYRGMDIGTGKDLAEYGTVPYHLIDICNSGEKYHVARFQMDFQAAYQQILSRNKQAIACGGTGMYLHALLQDQPYIAVPVDNVLRETLALHTKDQLIAGLKDFKQPAGFKIDHSSHKRLIRATEILTYLAEHPEQDFSNKQPSYPHQIFGLNPLLAQRRQNITDRLQQRLEAGLLKEIEGLLAAGLTHEHLQYYGLEYKYGSLLLSGAMDKNTFLTKLETEIHRYAKRQMTFFRKMEKDGVAIHWLASTHIEDQLTAILDKLKKG